MPINLTQLGYRIKDSDVTRYDALKIAITVFGMAKVLDHLDEVKIRSSAYGSNRVCVNISQKIERHFLNMTERDIAFVENVAASAIQKKWRHSISDPTYKVCRQRLAREFGELA
jgi:hypothetical protein